MELEVLRIDSRTDLTYGVLLNRDHGSTYLCETLEDQQQEFKVPSITFPERDQPM